MSLSRFRRLFDSHPLSFILKFEGAAKQSTLPLEQCRRGGGGGGGGGGRFFVGGIRHCLIYHSSHITPYPGVLPMMAYTGRLRPKGVLFFTLQVFDFRISLVKVYIPGFVITAGSAKNFIISFNFPCYSLFTELFACVVFVLWLGICVEVAVDSISRILGR